MPAEEFHLAREVGSTIPVAPHPASGGLHSFLRQSRDGPALSRQNRILTIDRGEVYRASRQAGPGNDINAGSPGSQKAPTWSPASLVAIRARASRAASRRPLRLRSFATAQEVARARWRRCFAFSLALRLLARIVVLALMVFIASGLQSRWDRP